NWRIAARHAAEQSQQRGFAVIVITQRVGLHLFGMPVGKGMMPVIKIGAMPADAVIIEPGGAEFSLETFAETAFGLGIDVDAFGDVGVHVNSSVLMVERSGRLKTGSTGNGAGRGCGRLASVFGRAGWESMAEFSQCGLAALFNLRR